MKDEFNNQPKDYSFKEKRLQKKKMSETRK